MKLLVAVTRGAGISSAPWRMRFVLIPVVDPACSKFAPQPLLLSHYPTCVHPSNAHTWPLLVEAILFMIDASIRSPLSFLHPIYICHNGALLLQPTSLTPFLCLYHIRVMKERSSEADLSKCDCSNPMLAGGRHWADDGVR